MADVNESTFLKSLMAKKGAASAQSSVGSSSYMSDEEIAQALGLTSPESSMILDASVDYIRFGLAKDDPNRPYFSFNYRLESNSPDTGRGKGIIVSRYIEISDLVYDGRVVRSSEDGWRRVLTEFDSLGEPVSQWGTDDSAIAKRALEAAKRLSSTGLPCRVKLNCFKTSKGSLGLRVFATEVRKPASPPPKEEVDIKKLLGSRVEWCDPETHKVITLAVTGINESEMTIDGVSDAAEEYIGVPVEECTLLDN